MPARMNRGRGPIRATLPRVLRGTLLVLGLALLAGCANSPPWSNLSKSSSPAPRQAARP